MFAYAMGKGKKLDTGLDAASMRPEGEMRTTKPVSDKAKPEQVFVLYRDMGVTRSYSRLREVMKVTEHGDVTVRTLSNWSTEEHWQARLAAYDRKSQPVRSQLTSNAVTDPEFDQADTLLRTAHLALQRVLSGTPVVQKASDKKSLTDAALGALKAVEMINRRQADKRSEVEGRAEMFAYSPSSNGRQPHREMTGVAPKRAGFYRYSGVRLLISANRPE
jgi:hypothetical protein